MLSIWSFALFILVGSYTFLCKHKHMLIMLLSLEIIMLGLFGFMAEGSGFIFSGEAILLTLFLVFSVCEGAVGLGLVVMFVRSFGTDYFNNFCSSWS